MLTGSSRFMKEISPSFDIKSVNIAKGSVATEIGSPWRHHHLVIVSGEATIEIAGEATQLVSLKEGDEALEFHDHRVLSVEAPVGSTLIVLSGG